jgi:hypothetical protein
MPKIVRSMGIDKLTKLDLEIAKILKIATSGNSGFSNIE